MSNIATEITLRDAKLFRQACYIDGTWVGAVDGTVINVDNPATGEVIGRVPRMGAAQTRQAIAAAAQALPAWRKRTAKERSIVLRRWFDLMMSNKENRLPNREARWSMRRHFSNGSARKLSASTAIRFPPPNRTRGLLS